jgi:hypothetical protein
MNVHETHRYIYGSAWKYGSAYMVAHGIMVAQHARYQCATLRRNKYSVACATNMYSSLCGMLYTTYDEWEWCWCCVLPDDAEVVCHMRMLWLYVTCGGWGCMSHADAEVVCHMLMLCVTCWCWCGVLHADAEAVCHMRMVMVMLYDTCYMQHVSYDRDRVCNIHNAYV